MLATALERVFMQAKLSGPLPGSFFGKVVLEPSSISLLASNLLVIALAVLQNWSILTIMLIYWMQSVTIGIFTFAKIMLMRNYSNETVYINGKPTELAGMGFLAGKIFMAGFFAVHYGTFHLVYLVFMLGFAFSTPEFGGPATGIDFTGAFATGLLFFLNHLFSFVQNYRRDINYSSGVSDIGATFMAPYARIIPMHLTIIFGFGFSFIFPGSIFPLVLFMLLKTYADLATHSNKHFVGNSTASQ